MRAPRVRCWVNKMITGRSCEKSHVYVSYQHNVLPATSLGSSVAECGSREALESILRGPWSGWFWTNKASLPSRRGGINLIVSSPDPSNGSYKLAELKEWKKLNGKPNEVLPRFYFSLLPSPRPHFALPSTIHWRAWGRG